MTVFVDIDGTLTTTPDGPHGPIRKDVLEAVRKLIHDRHVVVLWSAQGARYANEFARSYGLAVTCISKPDLCVDDRPTLRPAEKMEIVSPEDFMKMKLPKGKR